MSKIDLLVNQPYALSGGGDAVQGFYDELARIDPSGQAVDLGIMQARSQLVSRLREIFGRAGKSSGRWRNFSVGGTSSSRSPRWDSTAAVKPISVCGPFPPSVCWNRCCGYCK